VQVEVNYVPQRIGHQDHERDKLGATGEHLRLVVQKKLEAFPGHKESITESRFRNSPRVTCCPVREMVVGSGSKTWKYYDGLLLDLIQEAEEGSCEELQG
jgi:hypothetical protein